MNDEHTVILAKQRVTTVLTYALLIGYSVIALFPVWFSLVSSFKSTIEIFNDPFALPESYSFENYVRAWNLANVGTYFWNSVIYTASTTSLLAFVGSLAAYILARFRFRVKDILYIFFISGMMVPVHSTIIPLAFDIARFNLRDSYPAMIAVTSAFAIPITVFILTGFMKGIPRELEEAAVMDGAKAFYVFRKVILPMSVPAIATATIFNFLQTWNNLLFPLVFISDSRRMPIAYGLLSFFGEFRSDHGGLMAAIVITILPPVITYILLQEKVERGLTAGALKS